MKDKNSENSKTSSPVTTTSEIVRPVDFSVDSKVAIRVDNLSKLYALGTINHGTLAHDLQSWWAGILGKEDPNLPLESDGVRSEHFWALNDVSFSVEHGDTFGIIGKNGAGKSTLLKILSRITSPTKGEIKIHGRVASLLEVGTGFHPELTGRENIFLNGAILGMSKSEIVAKFDEIVAFSGVEKFLDTPVKRYSSGMYVRLAFAVAAHLEPEILIVDEVLAVGDAEFQKKCLGKMAEIGGEGRTVLFVSHNMGSIKALCKKGLILDQGQLVTQGLIDEVVHSYLDEGETLEPPSLTVENNSHKKIYISEVSVVDASAELSGHYPYDQPFVVKIKLFVKEQTSGVYLAAHIVDSDLQTIHFTRNFDLGDKGDNVLAPGEHVFSIEYPASFLVPDDYRISIHVVSVSPAEILDGVENVCRFELYDSGSIYAQKGLPWRGRIALPVKWRVNNP